ncbi:MAG TPA: hypothetical protein VEO91_11800 [Candidatus Limnocylindria bacterium]|nr:hypothetical protein [Candidatus Limnocylindria bacterium]
MGPRPASIAYSRTASEVLIHIEVALTPEVEEHAASRAGGGSATGLVDGSCPAGVRDAVEASVVDAEQAAASNAAIAAPRTTWRPIIERVRLL